MVMALERIKTVYTTGHFNLYVVLISMNLLISLELTGPVAEFPPDKFI